LLDLLLEKLLGLFLLEKLLGLFLLDRLKRNLLLTRSLAESRAVDLRAHWWGLGETAEPQVVLLFVVDLLIGIDPPVDHSSQLLRLIPGVDLDYCSSW
jgi:hypothetical protein